MCVADNVAGEANNVDMRTVKVGFKPLDDDAKQPFYAHRGDAGMDVYAASDYVILPGETVLISTDFAVQLPEGYELQVRPRSGLSLKTNLTISNSPGTIDSGYRDEIKIIMRNNSQMFLALAESKNIKQQLAELDNDNVGDELDDDEEAELRHANFITTEFGKIAIFDLDVKDAPHGAYKINKGDRIAQLVLAPVYRLEWESPNEQAAFDREGGFGHSGRR